MLREVDKLSLIDIQTQGTMLALGSQMVCPGNEWQAHWHIIAWHQVQNAAHVGNKNVCLGSRIILEMLQISR